MKKVLFIDRDGTLIAEPPIDFQVDSFEKLEFIPGVFRNLYQIASKLDYEFVIVTNQDGLGTASFPEDTFWPIQNKMIKAFENEGIVFSEILIDRSFPDDNKPTRKPGTAMLSKYLTGDYDLKASFVIGDRLTDIELAKNIGASGILIYDNEPEEELRKKDLKNNCVLCTNNWNNITAFLIGGDRSATVIRVTKETNIHIELKIDGKGKSNIRTGLGFFDHMLDQIARHSNSDLTIICEGDLNVDEHHTIEDTALALGEAFYKALGNKRGIERYGYVLPMDDCLSTVVIDFSGRNWFNWEAEFKREKVGEMPTEMFYHFFKSFSDAAKCNLTIKAEGENEHHKIEAIYKGLGRAIKMAVKRDVFNFELPSTKGSL